MLRVLIVGCGDVGLRVAARLSGHGKRHGRARLYALTRDPARVDALRALGITPVLGDLDRPESLTRLAGLAHAVLHLAPPPAAGETDTRTRALIAALARRDLAQLVYVSTSGVYGDCAGAWVDETRAPRPASARAVRRVDAERRLRAYALARGVRLAILRAPGIYAAERLPLERLRRGTPALAPEDDPYTNHIHADDLARAVIAALFRGRQLRVVHASDDSNLTMGEYFNAVADAFALPRPPRISRADAERTLPETQLSFMRESRRLTNDRLKRELRLKLVYPSVADFLASLSRETN
jgi:nucleoside-diphosphate-sugar epimerase